MTRVILAVLFCLLIVSMTDASDKAGVFVALGVGSKSCGTWIVDRKKEEWVALIDEAWLDGFLTAFNVYSSAQKNIANGTDANGRDAWIDNYCASHPLDSVAGAAQALIADFRSSVRP